MHSALCLYRAGGGEAIPVLLHPLNRCHLERRVSLDALSYLQLWIVVLRHLASPDIPPPGAD